MRGVSSDLTGMKFGRLTVIRCVGKDDKQNTMWECKCECGNIKITSRKNLVGHGVQSCGCLQQEARCRYEDLTGQTFNMLTVINFDHMSDSGHTYWMCKCECGNNKVVSGNKLKRGDVKSCGCYRKIAPRKPVTVLNGKPVLVVPSIYGEFRSTSPIIKAYRRMVSRCYNSNNPSYDYYHGKSIHVSSEWFDPNTTWENWRDNIPGMTQFVNDMYKTFIEHVETYGFDNTSLDRINGSKDYSKDNCRWATFHVQNNNISSNRHIFDGEEILTFSDCVRKYVPSHCLTGSYQKAPGGIISSKLERDWSVNQIVKFLRLARETGKLIEKKDLKHYLIRIVDQSCVYEKYPDEVRLPGYE